MFWRAPQESEEGGWKGPGALESRPVPCRLAVKEEDAHITLERMCEVVTKCNEILTDAEQQHIGRCEECLDTFGALVLDED